MRNSVFNILALVMVVFFASVGTVSATTLATTTNAYGSWQGSQNYSASGALSQNLDATVEYAVFKGTGFQDFLDENGIVYVDPSAAGDYTYAYQVTEVVEATAGLSAFTVNLLGDESAGSVGVTYIPKATNYGTYSPLPSEDPSAVGGGPGVSTSSQWMFSFLTAGEASGILFYSTPQGPEHGSSVVQAGTAVKSVPNALPNPVPEPATALLMSACVVLIAGGSRRRIARG